jgi:diacylglycerol kinase (ATP)
VRAAAIFGPGCSIKDLRPFQENSDSHWIIGLPGESSEVDAIVIFGGDGTLHRHLPQLAKLRLPVLVVPSGSGNDFARALKLRRIADSLAAWRKFSSDGHNVWNIDLGLITPFADKHRTGEAPAPHEYLFCCVGGIGLDAEISRRANLLPRWLRAHGGYVLSLLPALLKFAPFKASISLSRDGAFIPAPFKRIMVAAFANAPTYGGGMKIAPQAELDDGHLDICIVSDINKSALFCLFPTIYFGRHLRIPQVEYCQTERLRIETENPTDIYADGEYVCHTPVEVSVARKALRVIVP